MNDLHSAIKAAPHVNDHIGCAELSEMLLFVVHEALLRCAAIGMKSQSRERLRDVGESLPQLASFREKF